MASMEGQSKKEYLAGLFTQWLATDRGREGKPNAQDKKAGELIAESALSAYNYDNQFSYGGTKGVKNMSAAQRKRLGIA